MANLTYGKMKAWLVWHGYVVGERAINRNTDFSGTYMVCDKYIVGDPSGDGSDGYCIVGDDLAELVTEAYTHLV